jgi:hypothetical protein
LPSAGGLRIASADDLDQSLRFRIRERSGRRVVLGPDGFEATALLLYVAARLVVLLICHHSPFEVVDRDATSGVQFGV